MPSEDKVKDILLKLTMLGFEEEYDEKKDNLKSYLKGRLDAFNAKSSLSNSGTVNGTSNTTAAFATPSIMHPINISLNFNTGNLNQWNNCKELLPVAGADGQPDLTDL
jgi:hypothetical protein